MNPLLLDALYAGGMLVASPYFLYRAATTGKYRAGLVRRLGFVEPRTGGECIWVHGVSVGEVLAARGIVEALDKALPGEEIAVSSTTNTGYEVAAGTYPGRRVFYFPLDFSRAVARTFRRIMPKAVVLMEMEVWPNFISHARARGVPVIVANGRITQKAFRNYVRFGSFARSLLSGVDLFLVQNETYAERLRRLGVRGDRVRVTGSVKFDTVSATVDPARRAALRKQMAVGDEETLIIGGSTHETEEEALLDAWESLRRSRPGLRLLIVPRHKTRFAQVERLIRDRGHAVFKRSLVSSGRASGGTEILLGDTMGELEGLYEAADIAFVGGSLIPHGGQNVIEPAAKGKPVVFGASMENFPQESALLVEAGAAVQIGGPGELAAALGRFLDPDQATRAGAAGKEAVKASQGATAATVEAIRRILEKQSSQKVSRKGA